MSNILEHLSIEVAGLFYDSFISDSTQLASLLISDFPVSFFLGSLGLETQ
jgi:hypothetical protein